MIASSGSLCGDGGAVALEGLPAVSAVISFLVVDCISLVTVTRSLVGKVLDRQVVVDSGKIFLYAVVRIEESSLVKHTLRLQVNRIAGRHGHKAGSRENQENTFFHNPNPPSLLCWFCRFIAALY